VPVAEPNMDGVFTGEAISFQHKGVLVLHSRFLIFRTDLGWIDSTPTLRESAQAF
jgi:hypothetical protein